MSGRHVDQRHRRGTTAFGTVLPLVTVLLVCVTTAVVATVGLKNNSQATTDATLDLTSQRPLLPPAKSDLRGVSAARDSPLVSRSQTIERGKQAVPLQAEKPAKVVPGQLIV